MGEWRETWLPGQALPADGGGAGRGVPGGAGLDEAFEQYCCDSLPSPEPLSWIPVGISGPLSAEGGRWSAQPERKIALFWLTHTGEGSAQRIWGLFQDHNR